MARTRDPDGFAVLRQACDAGQVSPLTRDLSLRRIAAIMAAKGGLVSSITAGDCLELAAVVRSIEGETQASTGMYFYQLLRTAGVLPPETPASVRMFTTRGQLTPAELIGQYGIECGPVRDLAGGLPDRTPDRGGLLDPAGDRPHPGQAVLARPGTPQSRHQLALPVPGGNGGLETEDRASRRREAPPAARRLPGPQRPTLCSPSGRSISTSPSGPSTTPARWGQWAAPCPVRAEEIPHAKELSRRKARDGSADP